MDLTPVSYVVLGEVARHGAATPYELKRWVGESVGNFWSFPHAQLYKEPPRLAAAGLLVEQREEGGRRRRVFRLTPAGRAALDAWLAEPTPGRSELRDLGVLKLFFADQGARAQVVALAEGQVAFHRERLARYEGYAARRPAEGYAESIARVLALGTEIERVSLAFWEAVAADPPAGGAPPTPGTGEAGGGADPPPGAGPPGP